MLQKVLIDSSEHPMFADFWQIYQESFPLHERRALENQQTIFKNDTYRLQAWLKDGSLIGFIGWWIDPQFTFAEHYAIRPGLKSQGYGTRLLQEWMQHQASAPVVLEIEPVVDDITRRRLRFYQRLAFVENAYPHRQPPFHPGMSPVSLRLLSWPGPITEDIYQAFSKKLWEEIIPPHHS